MQPHGQGHLHSRHLKLTAKEWLYPCCPSHHVQAKVMDMYSTEQLIKDLSGRPAEQKSMRQSKQRLARELDVVLERLWAWCTCPAVGRLPPAQQEARRVVKRMTPSELFGKVVRDGVLPWEAEDGAMPDEPSPARLLAALGKRLAVIDRCAEEEQLISQHELPCADQWCAQRMRVCQERLAQLEGSMLSAAQAEAFVLRNLLARLDQQRKGFAAVAAGQYPSHAGYNWQEAW